jgi:hypothetical protein
MRNAQSNKDSNSESIEVGNAQDLGDNAVRQAFLLPHIQI